MKNIFNKHFFIFLFIILILNTFFCWNFFGVKDIGGDAVFYHQVGISLANGQGYELNGEKTMTREPGYPLFIAVNYKIFGEHPNIIRVEQVLFLYLTILFVYLLSKKIFGEPITRFSSLLFVVYPIFSIYSGSIVSEIFAGFLLACFLLVFNLAEEKRKYIYYFLAGLLLVFFIMTKNMFLFLMPLFFLLIILNKEGSLKIRFFRAFIFIISFFIIIAPWMARNYINFGNPMLASRGGVILYGHAIKINFNSSQSLKYIISSMSGEYFVRRFIDRDYNYERDSQGDELIQREREILAEGGVTNYDQADDQLKNVALRLIKEHPIKYLFWGLIEFNNLNSPIVYYERHVSIFYDNVYNRTFLKSSAIIILRIFWFTFICLAFYGIYRIIKKRDKKSYGVILAVFYVNIIIIILQGIPRFLMPILPFYFLFAMYGFEAFSKKYLRFFNLWS